jgi:phage terminase large subunit
VDEFFRQNAPDNAVVVRANWRDNPWFPAELEAERQLDLAKYPDRYDHIWEGGYVTILEGAYYARVLAEARSSGRIGRVAADPVLPLLAFCDIGGAGATADAFVIWICQFVDREIRVLDYYETRGQVLAHHIAWLRSKKYDQAKIYLPHDGVATNNVTGKRYEDHFRDAEFDVTVIPNQGRGAAAQRIEAARRIFPMCWFNEATTEAGRDALGFYHEKRDEDRNVGLGPDHDWSSHGADAFGLLAIAYEDPARQKSYNRDLVYEDLGLY